MCLLLCCLATVTQFQIGHRVERAFADRQRIQNKGFIPAGITPELVQTPESFRRFSFMAKKLTTITDEIRRKTLAFEVKSASMGEAGDQFAGEFEGYAAGIGNIDSTGDMILPGAFAADLPRFLAEGVVCWQHDWATPIGIPLSAEEDSYGLKTRCRVSKTTQGQDAMTLIRDGVVKKLSIGYRVKSYQWVDRAGLVAYLAGAAFPQAQKNSILGQYDQEDFDGIYLLKEIQLFEYSPVSIPANRNAIITDAKSLLAGLRLSEHSSAVRAAVTNYADRIKQLAELRQTEGRRFKSADHVEAMRAIANQMRTCASELDACCDGMTDPETDAGKAARVAAAEFLRLQARSLGCTV
ncbi:MAG: HK97 family phage prohead protease [Arenimonas sp.]